MTIGDGKFGSDAFYLQNHGVDVVATSLSSYTLEVAHERGYIKKYAVENAEAISLEDNAVDFVLCKAAYHHFPRPPVAFYEMFRVARKASILIEPIDGPRRPLSVCKSLAKKLLRGDVTEEFEVSGNFIYRLNVREIVKMLSALGYGCVAWKGINDFYHPRFGVADAKLLSVSSIGTKAGIGVQDVLSWTKLLNYGQAVVICFKEKGCPEVLSKLKHSGFTVLEEHDNPFLTGNTRGSAP